MSSIWEMDNNRRYLNSGDVKRACGWKKSDTKTYAKHRLILGVTTLKLTDREAFLLWVAAQCCLYKQDLDRPTIYQAAAELLARSPDAAHQTLKLCGSEAVPGHKLADAIGDETGYYPSEDSLRRWGQLPKMPPFSLKRSYSGAQVRRFINYAKKRKGIAA
jgi:hypothetical protein